MKIAIADITTIVGEEEEDNKLISDEPDNGEYQHDPNEGLQENLEI